MFRQLLDSNLNSILSLLGSTFGIVGALLIALNINMIAQGYMVFAMSSLFWVILAYRTSQRQLLTMNVVFIVINVIGLINYV
jgi:hypothetical protein